MDTIYYLLTDDSPIGWLHRNRSDIVHFYHRGAPIRYSLLHPDGATESAILGPDPWLGHHLQLAVPAGTWKASELVEGTYGLLSEAVTPAFSPSDREIATEHRIRVEFADLHPEIIRLIRPATVETSSLAQQE